MPLVQIKGLSGYLNLEQKREIIRKVTDAVVAVEGEGLRPVTWVLLKMCHQAHGAFAARP